MKTDVITVTGGGAQIDAVLREAEKTAEYTQLSHKSALHLRLLTEEMVGFLQAVTGETRCDFWIEAENGLFELHLTAETFMNSEKRRELLSAASSGRNEASRGLKGRIIDLFDRAADSDVPVFSTPMIPGDSSALYGTVRWSLEDYRRELARSRSQGAEGTEEAWDELEKSVLARVADEVRVSIRSGRVEIVIYKKMS